MKLIVTVISEDGDKEDTELRQTIEKMRTNAESDIWLANDDGEVQISDIEVMDE